MPKLDGFKKFMEKIDGTQRDVPEKKVSRSVFGSRIDHSAVADVYTRHLREELERSAADRDRRDVQMGMHSQRPMWQLDDEDEDTEHSPSYSQSERQSRLREAYGGSPAEPARANLRQSSPENRRYFVRSTPSGAFSWEELDRMHREHIEGIVRQVRETSDPEGS